MGIRKQFLLALLAVIICPSAISSLEINSLHMRSRSARNYCPRHFPNRQILGVGPFRTRTVEISCRNGSQQLTNFQSITEPADVLIASDLFYGTLIALALAVTASFLQRRRHHDDFDLGGFAAKEIRASEGGRTDGNYSNGTIVFDSWKEISRPDNYVFYNRRARGGNEIQDAPSAPSLQIEKIWVLLALLALFVPIFSVELFFAVSRQLICGANPMHQLDWSEFLCSPAVLD